MANEIRTLAEESSESTKSIDQMVQDLQRHSKEAVLTMEHVATIVDEQVKSVMNNKEKYNMIEESMQHAGEEVEKLNQSSDEMDAMKQEMLGTMDNLSAIAQENSAATEEVTSSVEEQVASMNEIANTSGSLANLAQDLQSIIDRFKI